MAGRKRADYSCVRRQVERNVGLRFLITRRGSSGIDDATKRGISGFRSQGALLSFKACPVRPFLR
jgi:hypothetical protein